ncbi:MULTISPECIES: alpha-amylase family glycosyl hydrolase [Paenibacillus]|uniref:Cyclomaltodextrin glucanotransferase n=1 Tax=Paenibacillus albilobatus TaxID=2716884 RepID=A0A919XGG1_9BACL|nr:MULTISPECIES: alpha-amylase family glycosyl hydrolase [Paenibacillus]GIO30953.1 putative cyclomaltodextrin glucanotransferase [Paenibacillus albilobatus]
MKKFLKTTAAFALGLSLIFGLFSPAQAAPDTSVSNKQNFSTDVIYQIFTDRFSDGNPANNPTGAAFDGTCTNLRLYCGGDWQGIINKINDGYLTGMGITAIWISQPVENIYSIINYSGVNNTAYHGYWARDFKKTNPAYGTIADFQNLIAAAHAKNIKVIIDFAPNHTSPASSDQPSFAENGRLYNNGTLLGGYTNDTQNLFHHNGGTDFSTIENGIYKNLYDLADLNHNNSTVDVYLKDAIKMWLDLGIDGIRMDAVKHMPFGWQKSFMATVNNYKPVFTFGEWFLGVNEVSPENHQFANESGMSLLDFRFAQKVRQVFRDNTDNMYGLKAMLEGSAADYAQVDDQVTFIDNHDMERFHASNANRRKLEQALAFTLTSRGVPAIYYGTEQYMSGGTDPDNRARIPSFSTSTTAYQVIQKLAPLRKSNPAIAYGSTQERWINNDVLIYERKFGGNVAVVAVNRNLNTPASISGLVTSLPQGSYNDVLGGLLNGNALTVGTGGAASNFTLAAGGTAVWQYTTATATPTIGHVGPMMAKPGVTITIDGRGFGSTKGTVYFGTTAVTGANITAWEDTEIKVKIPAVAGGIYNIKIANAAGTESNVYDNFEVLSGDQVSVRFVVNNATTALGQNVYLTGSVSELGNWDPAKAIGPMYNQVVYQYPNWYYDVSVPAGKTIEFKFLKKQGSTVTWEGGSNHTFTAPASGTATINVNWQP